MPFNVKRGPAVIIEKEILRSPAGLDDILSLVIDSTKIIENPASSGRYILEAGTLLVTIAGSSKVQPVYEGSSIPGGETVVAILGHTREFWLGPGVTAGSATDEPAPGLHHGNDFNISKLVGYTGNETAVKAALFTCLFR